MKNHEVRHMSVFINICLNLLHVNFCCILHCAYSSCVIFGLINCTVIFLLTAQLFVFMLCLHINQHYYLHYMSLAVIARDTLMHDLQPATVHTMGNECQSKGAPCGLQAIMRSVDVGAT